MSTLRAEPSREALFKLFLREDPALLHIVEAALDFSADVDVILMERLTGFSMSIFAIDVAHGKVPAGAIRYENAMTGGRFVKEIQRRGVGLKFTGF